MRLAMLLLFAVPTLAAERTVTFTSPMYFLPPTKAIVVSKAGEPAPGQPKHVAVVTVTDLKESAKLATDGPFDLWFVPKDGRPVRVAANWKPTLDSTEVKLNDALGVIAVRGAGQPRGSLLVVPFGDPGPEGKGHTVVQAASEVRADLAVPPGDYAVWLVPAGGARARPIVDKVRVQAGKTATVD